MVNFGPLAAEIGPVVWGTPANFDGFHVLAALLHGTPVLGISQTLRRWTVGAIYIRQSTTTLGIGPHSSLGLVLTDSDYYFYIYTMVITVCYFTVSNLFISL